MSNFGPFLMRAPKPVAQSWFRIENAHVDNEQSDSQKTLIYIYDMIGDSWFDDATPASEFIKQLSAIRTPEIELHLNSPGGDVFDGVAIYNALKAHPAKVTVVVDALAASAASFIAQAGDDIIITKAGMMMIHDASGFAAGNAEDMRKMAGLLDQVSNTVAEIYADRSGQGLDLWRNLMIEETWYNSHEAVSSGLADRIGEDTKKEDKETVENNWFPIFNYAGRAAAPDPLAVRQRIANRLKERTVADAQDNKQTGQNQPAEEDKNTSSPDLNPDAKTTDGNADEVQKERDQNPGAVPDPPGNPEAKSGFQPTNVGGTVTFKMNGQVVTDASAVQKHIDMLEGFRKEANEESRKNFVTQLSNDNKILASQINAMTEYALGLDDEQFAAWAKLYNASPALPMVGGSHADQVSDSDAGPKSQETKEKEDRIDVLKGIVKQHMLRNASHEEIQMKESYKELKKLDPSFDLEQLESTFKP